MKRAVLIIAFLFLVSCAENNTDIPEKTEKEQSRQAKEDVLLGSFETKILDADEKRMENINLSIDAIDGAIIKKGEEFSFNGIIGARTKEKGYEEATILVGCEKEKAVGGGICQVSSTIYNAVKNAGLEIVERHSHSAPVHYLPQGEDAAISFGTLDFKFKNNLDSNIKLAVSTDGKKVYAAVFETEG